MLAKLPNGRLQRRDFFSMDLADAGLVVCYLYPGAMEKLKVKFERELKPGCWVITHTFAVPGWKAEAVYPVDDLYRTQIYVYRIPKRLGKEAVAQDQQDSRGQGRI